MVDNHCFSRRYSFQPEKILCKQLGVADGHFNLAPLASDSLRVESGESAERLNIRYGLVQASNHCIRKPLQQRKRYIRILGYDSIGVLEEIEQNLTAKE